MIGVNETARCQREHGAIASRLTGIATSLFFERPVQLVDAGDPRSSHHGRTIVLERAETNGLEIAGKGGTIRYSDSTSEATIAALVALLCTNGGPVAADPVSLAVISLADRLAQTDIPVLIHGPTGTGKEVAARMLHSWSGRADSPFIIVAAARMDPDRVEEELFGIEDASGLVRPGFLEQAHGGTLYLDEIADMPLTTQGKILRVLTDQSFTRVGGQRQVKVDVRVIATSNRDMQKFVDDGSFRRRNHSSFALCRFGSNGLSGNRSGRNCNSFGGMGS